MNWRTYYRIALVGMALLVIVGSIEYRVPGLIVVLFGYAVWRAELPSWDELWSRWETHDD